MEPLHIADDVELHVVFLEFQEILAQVTLHELHDVRHFFIRALPIFRRKGIDRQDLDAQVVGSDDDALERIGTGAMAVTAGQALALGPAAIAVHDDGYVAGNVVRIQHGFGHGACCFLLFAKKVNHAVRLHFAGLPLRIRSSPGCR